MNVLDIIILVPIAYGLVRGLIKGFVHELTSLVAIAAGVVGAKIWAPALAVQLATWFNMQPKIAQPLSYLLLFIAIALCLHLVGKLFEKILKTISLGGVNKLLGALFGCLKFALVVSILLNGFAFIDAQFQLLKPKTKDTSVLYRPVQKLAGVAWDTVQEHSAK